MGYVNILRIGLPYKRYFVVLDNAQASGGRNISKLRIQQVWSTEKYFVPGMIRNLETETGKW